MADSHRVLTRAFIQIMLDRRFLPLPEVKTLVGALNQKYDYDLNLEAEEDLLDFINALNPSLATLHLKLSQAVDEERGHRVFVLCNTLSSELSRNPTFNEQQMAFFRRLVSSIVESADGSLELEQAECAIVDIPHCTLTSQQVKDTIQQLIKQKYLRCTGGNVSLTPSALTELQPYISATMPDHVSNCFGCNSLCIRGERCPNGPCTGRIHSHCAETVFKRKKTCRVCKKEWNVGELSE